MTTYNTGNPIGSSAAKDLYDNAENLDVAINSSGRAWVDRLGAERLTVKAMEEATPDAIAARNAAISAADAAISASSAVPFKTLAAMNASTPPAPTAEAWAVVTNDVTPANNGFWNWSGSAWVKSALQPVGLSAFNSLDSDMVNKGKMMPLKKIARNSITSIGNAIFDNLFLSAKIFGARAGKVYRIEWIGNGVVSAGAGNAYAIWISEYDAETYGTSDAAGTVVIGHLDYDFSISPGVGKVTRVIRSKRIPEITVSVTYDTAAFGAATYVGMNNQASTVWSWIVDPSLYVAATSPSSDLSFYSLSDGLEFPLQTLVRDGESNPKQLTLDRALLDIKVSGARPGKLYRLEWYGNGTTAFGGVARYDMLFSEYDASTFSTNSASGMTVAIGLTDLPNTTPWVGVGTRVFKSTKIPGLSFSVTLDASKIAVSGAIGLNSASPPRTGYSQVIHPLNYYPSAGTSTGADGALQYAVGAGGVLEVSYASRLHCMKWVFGPNGANSLPNVISVWKAPGTDLSIAVWELLNSAPTDWLPPLIFDSVVPGASAPNGQFTGGNHLVGGAITATSVRYEIFADGKGIAAGDQGRCSSVRVVVVNDLMAGNTVVEQRYAARQFFNLNFADGACFLDATVVALEDVVFKHDYGLQAVTGGFQSSQLIVNGTATGREAFDANKNSGPKSERPDAWGVALDGEGVQLVMWIDKTYGAGLGDDIAPTEPLVRGGGGANTKFYLLARRNMGNVTVTPAKQGYKYRGGYCIQTTPEKSAAIDTSFPVRIGAPTGTGLVQSDSFGVLI